MNCDKQKTIEDLLEKLSYKEYNDEIQSYLNGINDFFTNQNNYKRLSLMKKIIKIKESHKYGIEYLSKNIIKIQELNEANQSSIGYKIRNLIDFILLEIERCNKYYFFDKQDFDSSISNIKTTKDEIDKQYKIIQEISQETKHTKTELITILGIFTAIVIGFVGEMVFSSSVLSNMKDIEPYEMAFVISSLSFGFINIIFGLFIFLMEITKGNPLKKYNVTHEKNGTLVSAWIILGFITGLFSFISFMAWITP